jgi:glutamate synthase domain-containing protein 1
MCRLIAITSENYISPMDAVSALETMKEGHDGSGMGLILKNLGGELSELKNYPALSGICSHEGMQKLDDYMIKTGFKPVHEWRPTLRPLTGIRKRDNYFVKFYDYPEEYNGKLLHERENLLLKTRLRLRKMGEDNGSIVIFSFYPDVLILKEVGDPMQLAEFFGLTHSSLAAKIIFAQGRQNTNYAINLYACHPFFIQGFCTMTNGENTAFTPIREFLASRKLPGYTGYNSDSEVFTHILHYTVRQLKYPLIYYKDIITPLTGSEMEERPDRDVLRLMKTSLRPLCIDGPNCVIGFTPDGTCFMVQDAKKLRPGVAGGRKGMMAFSSEECGLDRIIPERNHSMDIFPMKYDMIVAAPEAKEVKVWNQLRGWTTTIN